MGEYMWYAVGVALPHVSAHQIHLFGEGKVNQESNDIEKPNAAKLLRFKWGM